MSKLNQKTKPLIAEVNGERYTIPQSYAHITLGAFLNLEQIDDNDEAGLINALTYIPKTDIRNMSLGDYKSLVIAAHNILNQSFEDYYPEYQLKIKGRYFRLIDFEDMSFGTYLDLNNELDAMGLQSLGDIMALLYVEQNPIWKPWQKHLSFEDKKKLFLSMPMSKVAGTISFFLTLYSVYNGSSATSSTLMDSQPAEKTNSNNPATEA